MKELQDLPMQCRSCGHAWPDKAGQMITKAAFGCVQHPMNKAIL